MKSKSDVDINSGWFMLGVIFILLGIIYMTIGIFSLIKFIQIYRKSMYLGSIFYISILFSCIAYMTNMSIYVYDVIQEVQREIVQQQLLNTIYIPDCIFWITYQSLFAEVICMYYDSRMHSGQLSQQPINPKKLKHYLEFTFIIYIFGQCSVIYFYNFEYLSSTTLIIINLIINVSYIPQYLVAIIYLCFKYSGSPFKSKNYEAKTNRLNKLVIFWTIMRLIQAIVNLLVLEDQSILDQFFKDNLDQKQILIYIAIFVQDLLLCNIIPYILALRQASYRLFLKTNSVSASEVFLRPQYQNIDSSIQERKLIQFQLSDIIYDNNQIKQKCNNGFGIIKNGIVFNKQYSVRIVNLNQISSYMMDEIQNDFEKINTLNHQYISHIHGYVFNKDQLIYLQKYYQYSLTEYLLSKQSDTQELLDILIQICRGINYLHNQNQYHGHLHCSNIMLNKNKRAKIVDIGIFGAKKYASIIFGYSTKSAFTAPELFTQRGQIVNGTAEGDIYSLGMVMYQVFEQKIPFQDLTIQEIQECLSKKVRPKCTNMVLVR